MSETTILQMPQNVHGPHQGQPLLSAGLPLEKAKGVMILVHGRGGSAANSLSLADDFKNDQFAYLAPQASHSTWYPHSFLAPLAANQPGLDSGLQAIADAVSHALKAGHLPDKIMIGGFSQGACLSMEFVARNAQRFGGAFAFSGGVIGPLGMPRAYAGQLDRTPIFLGCSDVDFHIPVERVHESADVFTKLGAQVSKKIYPQMGHMISFDEIQHVKKIMAEVVG